MQLDGAGMGRMGLEWVGWDRQGYVGSLALTREFVFVFIFSRERVIDPEPTSRVLSLFFFFFFLSSHGKFAREKRERVGVCVCVDTSTRKFPKFYCRSRTTLAKRKKKNFQISKMTKTTRVSFPSVPSRRPSRSTRR